MRMLRAGIIGCGGIANHKHMPAIKRTEKVEMVAFCDIIAERARQAAADFGAPGAQAFEDYHDLLALDLDIAYVLTPNDSHAPITVAALQSGKDVMCEKPMATSYKAGLEMTRTARETGRKLTIGYQNRFRPDSWYLKQCCRAGDLGEIYYARAQSLRRRGVPARGVFLDKEKQGGGPLIDIGTHALDLTLWCMDNYEPELVVGTTYQKLAHRANSVNSYGSWDPAKFTVEDSAFGFIRMRNGATVYLESSWALNTLDESEAKTILCGTEGGADMQGENGALRINGERLSRLYVTKPDLTLGTEPAYLARQMSPADREAAMWIDHVLDGSKPLVTRPEEALAVTQILEAIYASADSGKPVAL